MSLDLSEVKSYVKRIEDDYRTDPEVFIRELVLMLEDIVDDTGCTDKGFSNAVYRVLRDLGNNYPDGAKLLKKAARDVYLNHWDANEMVGFARRKESTTNNKVFERILRESC